MHFDDCIPAGSFLADVAEKLYVTPVHVQIYIIYRLARP